jgi:hypothetical protein
LVELKSWSIVSTHTPSLERRRPLPESLDLRRHRQRPPKLLNSPQTVNPGPRLCQPNHLGIMYLTSALINKKQHNSLAETCVCLASAGSSLSSSSNRFLCAFAARQSVALAMMMAQSWSSRQRTYSSWSCRSISIKCSEIDTSSLFHFLSIA